MTLHKVWTQDRCHDSSSISNLLKRRLHTFITIRELLESAHTIPTPFWTGRKKFILLVFYVWAVKYCWGMKSFLFPGGNNSVHVSAADYLPPPLLFFTLQKWIPFSFFFLGKEERRWQILSREKGRKVKEGGKGGWGCCPVFSFLSLSQFLSLSLPLALCFYFIFLSLNRITKALFCYRDLLPLFLILI